jgi:hypothetical protein
MLGLCVGLAAWAHETDPVVTSWQVNEIGTMGTSPDSEINAVVSGILADVERVRYDATNVYIDASGVPSHSVGPFPDGNPAGPSDLNSLFRIPRTTPGEGAHTDTPLSSIGVFVNGVTMYNQLDAMSYENEGVWNNNAIVVRADGMDSGLGHPSPLMMGPGNGGAAYEHTHSSGAGIGHTHGDAATNVVVDGLYHYHQQPPLLRAQLGDDGSKHSPLIGFGFDGIPMYGPYGYDNTDGTGGVTRIESSYRLRSISDRSTLPDGTVLAANLHGPAINVTYPLGYFVEDFEYVDGFGDLDEYNGRFAVTPEYPDGVYAYYATIDSGGDSAYPYLLGPQFYGTVIDDNLNQNVTVPGGAIDFVPSSEGNYIISTSGTTTLFQGFRAQLVAPAGKDYQWKKNGSPMADDAPRVIGVTGKVLTFDPIMAADAGTYTVTYEDEAKAASETITFVLSVTDPGLLSATSKSSQLIAFLTVILLGGLALMGGDWIGRRKGVL